MARQSERVYNDRYEVLRPIARGGMAEVYLARDQLLDRPVALKVLFPELATDPSFVERFRREAQAAANLSHPNIISVYDWGEEAGAYFIVMEYVDGQPLSNILRSEGPLLADRAAAIGASVAAALGFAHRNGVVHRDVKPGNILIDAHDQVKIGDFGIARAASAKENLTQTGAVMGTATYFSPEQAQGLSVDPRSDVYALGVVLYEMVAGRPPFQGDNPVSVAYKHVREEPPPLREINASVPAAFASIVEMAMEKSPADRYASAEDLRGDLLRFRQGRPVTAARRSPPTAAMAATSMQPAADGTRAMPAATAAGAVVEQRKTSTYVVLLFVMLGLLAVLLFLLGRSLDLFGSNAGGQVPVPNVIGQPVADASAQLKSAGLNPKTQFEANDGTPNVVFGQDPQAGTKVKRGGDVTIRVSKGPGAVKVPNVVGRKLEDAQRLLEEAGGFQTDVTQEPDDTVASGTVIKQDPASGDDAPKGATINLTVSSGKQKVPVPDVRGKDVDVAANELGQAGFKTSRQQEASDSVADGKVIRTSPSPGTPLERGSTVTLVVSSGPAQPAQVTVPDVIGQTEASATNELQAAGFKVKTQEVLVTADADDGRVQDQSPNAGTKADAGSTVTITVGKKAGP
ncbi:MAG: eukaryotic-like serine/threonine-protein kinase [Actinomycetota bacterium]|jgi:serine/threonine-protein kinase|nr:eukaryotic-like serine/threonine-protein kinase [Actinomycetota bacterium]